MSSKDAYLRQAYMELAKADTSGDFERALRTANRVLKQYPHETTAFKCKVVSLIHLNKFEDTLTLLRKTAPNLTRGTHFEKAYCEYRLYKTDEAVETLLTSCENDQTQLDSASKELLAQLYYRQDKFDECQKLYLKLLKSTADDFDAERQANLMAAHSQLAQTNPDGTDKLKLAISTYEQHYNQACFLVAKRDFAGANKHLKKSLESCRAVLTEDGVPDDEIEDEMAIINAQLAYCQQQQGKTQVALDAYHKILSIKPSDPSAVAVASNNVVSIRQHSNLFDARKKLKSCQGAQIEQRLSRQQNHVVAFNNALLQLHSNQLEACKRAVGDLRERPSCATQATMVEAALLARQKDTAKATACIKNYLTANPNLDNTEKNQLGLLLAQIQLQDGDVKSCISTLQSVYATANTAFEPSLVSLMVTLSLGHDTSGKAAMKLLDDVVANTQDPKWLSIVLEQSALLHIKYGEKKRAVELLEKLRELKPDDPRVVSRLMRIYGDIDAGKAEQLAKTLPALMEKVGASSQLQLSPGTSIEALESSESILYSKSKKITKDPTSPKGGVNADIRKRRQRKRKVRLPKDLDPNVPVDPERWLPKQERSTYKKKKDKRAKDREIGRGPQGAVSDAASAKLDASAKPNEVLATASDPNSPKTPVPSAPAGAGPRQQRPGAKAKAKANKRKF